jgi:fibronectin-binding autotransporter adhesin
MANKKITDLTELTAANIANNDVLAIVDVGGNETKKVAISSLYDIFDNNVTIDTGKLVFGLTGANTNISALSVNTLPLIGGTITGPVVSYSINSSSNVSIAQSLAIGYVDHRVPQANLDVKDNVFIGGATTIAGALTLGTDLAVAHGGTGASSLTDGGVLLGSGTNAITAMGVLSDGQMIVGDGSTDPVAESGDTLRNSIGVGSTASGTVMQVYSANASGNVSIGRSLAVGYTDGRVPQANVDVKGNVYIDGNTHMRDQQILSFGTGKDLKIYHDGGNSWIDDTGTGSLSIKGSATLITNTSGQNIIAQQGSGAILYYAGQAKLETAPSGVIIRYGLGANVAGNVSVSRSLAVGYTDGRVPQANLEVKGNTHITGATTIEGALTLGTDLAVAQGGTGASTLGDGHVLLGSGTSAITALDVTAKGSILAGDGSGDPRALAVGSNDLVLTADSSETTGLKWAAASDEVSAGDVLAFYSANTTGNVSLGRGLAVGYVGEKIPGANLDVNGNAFISGATTIGGALTLGTDLAVAQGGTGASSLTDGGVLLGSGTSAITAMGVLTDGQMIVGDGSTDPVAESGATLRTSIGVGTGDSPQFTAVNIGAATDTTVARASAGDINVEGNLIYRAGGTDVPVSDGGTGASTLGSGGVLFGSGTGAITFSPLLTDGVMLVGDGSGDPVLEGNTALRTSIGVGTGDTPQFFGANVTGNSSINRSLAVGYTDGRVPRANLEVKGNVFISGNVAIAGATNYPEDVKAVFGSQETGPLQIFHSSGDVSKIEDLSGTSGGLRLRSSSISLRDAEDDVIIAASSTGAFLYHNGNERLKTISGGIIMSGGLGANVSGNVSVSRSLAVGFTDGRIPRANLEVTGNVFIGGQPSSLITGPDTSVTFASGLGVASGGTGAQSFTDGGVLLGSGTSAITAMGVLTDGQMIVGDGSTDPVAESGATLRTSIGVGTGDNVEFTNVTSTGVILAADGAVGAPSITNTGDTNTGIYFPASDNVAISVGGREAIQFGGKARGGLVDSNIRISSNVVNHQGLSTTNYTEYANNIVNAGSSFTVSTGTNVSRYTLDQSIAKLPYLVDNLFNLLV